MKIFGYLSLSFIITLIFFSLGKLTGSNFINDLYETDAIQYAITLLGFNAAVQAILVGQLVNYETLIKQAGHFRLTRIELKHNLILNVVLLMVMFTTKFMYIEDGGYLQRIFTNYYSNVFNESMVLINSTCLILIVMLILETLRAVYMNFEESRE